MTAALSFVAGMAVKELDQSADLKIARQSAFNDGVCYALQFALAKKLIVLPDGQHSSGTFDHCLFVRFQFTDSMLRLESNGTISHSAFFGGPIELNREIVLP